MLLFPLASIVGFAFAATPGVDVDVQLLFNSSGTQYPTDFTRDIVPVESPFISSLMTYLERHTLTQRLLEGCPALHGVILWGNLR